MPMCSPCKWNLNNRCGSSILIDSTLRHRVLKYGWCKTCILSVRRDWKGMERNSMLTGRALDRHVTKRSSGGRSWLWHLPLVHCGVDDTIPLWLSFTLPGLIIKIYTEMYSTKCLTRLALSIKGVRIKDSMWGWTNDSLVKSSCFATLKTGVWIPASTEQVKFF